MLPASFEPEVCVAAVAPRSGESYASTYLATAKALADWLAKQSTSLHLLWASSTRVFGNHGGASVDEHSPCLPQDEQGRILLLSEKTLQDVCNLHGHRLSILRLSGLYEDAESLREIYSFSLGGPRAGTPTDSAHWIQIDDAARAFNHCLDHGLLGVHIASAPPVPIDSFLRPLHEAQGTSPLYDPLLPRRGGSHFRLNPRSLRESGFQLLYPSPLEDFLALYPVPPPLSG